MVTAWMQAWDEGKKTLGRDCSGDMTWATNRAASGGSSSPGVDDARPALDVASIASQWWNPMQSRRRQ